MANYYSEESKNLEEEELKEAEKMTLEMDTVSDMLTRLASEDTEVSKAAQEEIDSYLLQKERAKEQATLEKDVVDGCKTVSERTVLNTNESILNRRKNFSSEYKTQVNNQLPEIFIELLLPT